MPNSPLRSKVSFYELEKAPWLRNRRLLKQFIPLIFQSEKKHLTELIIVFCSDKYLLSINQQYLNHDDYTDIITFDLSHDTTLKGEMYISLERIKENSVIFGTLRAHELQRVIFHGALHLCGLKDKSRADTRVMRTKEDLYLKEYHQYVSRETRST